MIECLEKGDGLAISLNHLKSHLRLESSEEDLYLEQLVRTAMDYCEKATQRTFLTKTYRRVYIPREEDQKLRTIDLFYPPLVNIQSVVHLGKGNKRDAVQRYMLTPSTYRPRISVWGNAIEITYKAGYGDKSNDIPDSLRQAITLIAAEMYEKRTESPDIHSKTVDLLIQPYKVRPCL